jgi:diaminohydroxyphosphoribosylaminopyrimidine deaminase / 5-amino-6-(5-phosphoribosylamino)uracil reductase
MRNDETYMRRALALARRGRGRVEPNPMVGCVIVRDGEVIGEGWHRKFGGPHAEVHAVNQAKGRVRGATVYVTLEPCCHHGKTPPCADLLIEQKVQRVVMATRDPSAKVSGKGARKLRRAGIEVEVGLMETEAKALIAPFAKLTTTGRPWVIAKWAMTLDGKIATRTGQSKWISSPEARTVVHRTRGQVDAVIIGAGTALADDPELTCRWARGRQPKRVVLDGSAKLPLTSKLVRSAREVPVIVSVSERADKQRLEALSAAGCQVVVLPDADGRIALPALLDLLGSMEMTNVLVEGGGEVLGACFDANLVDEVMVFVGPKIVGGPAKSPVLGHGVADLTTAFCLGELKSRRLGDSFLITGRRSPT